MMAILGSTTTAVKLTPVPTDTLVATLAFILISISIVNSRRLAELPADYTLLLISLVVFCPLGYWVGRLVGAKSDAGEAARLLNYNILIVLAYIIYGAIGLGPGHVSEEAGSYYQFMGDGLSVTALAAYSMGYRPKFLVPYLLVALLLLGIGSRASALAFIACFLFLRPKLLLLGITTGTAFVVVGTTILATIDLPPWLNQFRVISTSLALITDGTADLSYLDRYDYFMKGLAIIREYPLTGLIGYEFEWGGSGDYMHNALHLWASFGLPAFLVFVLALVAPAILTAHLRDQDARATRGGSQPALGLIYLILVQFALFRHPNNFVLFYALGIAASIYLKGHQTGNASEASLSLVPSRPER
jgi:hypothetical protein